MPNYNSTLQSNNIDLQSILNTINDLPEAGGAETVVDDVSRSIIEGTITEISDDSIEKIGNYAFCSCSSLTSVNFPVCTNIGNSAFQYCYSLTSVNFPACTYIGRFAFSSCSTLTSISFPVCTSIGNSAFQYCYNLTSVNFPACTYIGYGAFGSCSALTSINFPACASIGSFAFHGCRSLASVSFPVCTSIGSYAFAYCNNLTSVSFPACTSIGSYAFYVCSNLTSVSFPVCTNIYSNAFAYCNNLTSVSFPACTSIGGSAFYSCRTLSSLTLGASTVCTLQNSNAFTSTPYAGYSAYFSGTPYIYVPASLISAYQSATNWTYFSSYFSAIGNEVDDGSGGNGDSSNLITFSIDNDEYQAEDGMTWGEWVESDYNTIGCFINSSGMVRTVEDYSVLYMFEEVVASDIIIADKTYMID